MKGTCPYTRHNAPPVLEEETSPNPVILLDIVALREVIKVVDDIKQQAQSTTAEEDNRQEQ